MCKWFVSPLGHSYRSVLVYPAMIAALAEGRSLEEIDWHPHRERRTTMPDHVPFREIGHTFEIDYISWRAPSWPDVDWARYYPDLIAAAPGRRRWSLAGTNVRF